MKKKLIMPLLLGSIIIYSALFLLIYSDKMGNTISHMEKEKVVEAASPKIDTKEDSSKKISEEKVEKPLEHTVTTTSKESSVKQEKASSAKQFEGYAIDYVQQLFYANSPKMTADIIDASDKYVEAIVTVSGGSRYKVFLNTVEGTPRGTYVAEEGQYGFNRSIRE